MIKAGSNNYKNFIDAITQDDVGRLEKLMIPYSTYDIYLQKISFSYSKKPHIADVAAYYGAEKCLRHITSLTRTALSYNDKSGSSIAHYSAHSNDISIFFFLLDQNVSFNVFNKNLLTPLHIAAQNGNTEICKILWMNNIFTDDLSSEGFSPLHYAFMNEHYDTTTFLLSAGSDPLQYTLKGKSLYDLAIEGNNSNAISYLIDNHVKQIANGRSNYPIHEAIERKRKDIANFLISSCCDIDARDKNYQTPLILAAKHGYYNLCIHLLDAGAEIDATDANGRTALHYASKCGFYDIVELLIDFGADIEIEDYDCHTAMNLAYLRYREDIVDLFVELGLSNDNLNEINPDTTKHVRNPKWGNRMMVVKEPLDEYL